MSTETILFSTGCPKCRVLETKLKSKKIKYRLSDSIEEMQNYGVTSIPMLFIENKLYKFADAVNYVNNMEVVNEY